MTFGGSPHSAEKVQHDINSILDAIAQMLAKVRLQEWAEEEKLEQALPLLEERPEVDPAWVSITELDDEQKRLTGHDPRLLNPGPPPQLESVPVRIQIGDAVVAGALEGDLREQLLQLPQEQVAYLRQVVEPTASPGEVEVIEGEIVDIEIDGMPCFHHGPPNQLSPHLERIPYGEAEQLVGQDLGESSITHPELLVEPPVLMVEVLPDGQVEYDPRLDAQIEGLALVAESSEERAESAGEAVAELSPEARSALETVQQFFALTGLQAFEGQHYRLRMAGNQLSVEAKDGRGEVLVVDGEKAVSRLEAQDFRQIEIARELLENHFQKSILNRCRILEVEGKEPQNLALE